MLELGPSVRQKVVGKVCASLRVNFVPVVNQGWVLLRVRENGVSEQAELNQAPLLNIDPVEEKTDVVLVELCKTEVNF